MLKIETDHVHVWVMFCPVGVFPEMNKGHFSLPLVNIPFYLQPLLLFRIIFSLDLTFISSQTWHVSDLGLPNERLY